MTEEEVAAADSDLRLVAIRTHTGIESATQLDLSVSVSNVVQSAAAGAVGGFTAIWGATWGQHWQSPLHEAQAQSQTHTHTQSQSQSQPQPQPQPQSQSQSQTLEIVDAQEEGDNKGTDWSLFSVLTEDKD